ncbi:MAG: GntR family transcriptional regulator [Desulfohalobiaceae bacterium]|nr:GntR family transcriptional regulator [Desulfohalobiaceae bacterium]
MIESTPGIDKPKAQPPSDLAYKAYMSIRQMLFYNDFSTGQKIKYQDLAKRIGVSMTPVIQALKWLEFKGIVRHEPNRGYYINEISGQEIKEIYDTRQLLETSLLPETIEAVSADPAGLETLEAVLKDFEEAVKRDDYHSRMITDMHFHMTLASLSKCRVQLKMLQELFDLLLLKYSRNLFYASMMGTSLQDHRELFENLRDKNLRALEKALISHIQNVKVHILKGMNHMQVRKKEAVSDLYTFG